jgi:hypothetical protein
VANLIANPCEATRGNSSGTIVSAQRLRKRENLRMLPVDDRIFDEELFHSVIGSSAQYDSNIPSAATGRNQITTEATEITEELMGDRLSIDFMTRPLLRLCVLGVLCALCGEIISAASVVRSQESAQAGKILTDSITVWFA